MPEHGDQTPADGPPSKRYRPSDETRKRSSRATYVSKACAPCRRRKTKCDGRQPCDRCRLEKSTCAYDPWPRRRSQEGTGELSRMNEQLSRMQDQIQHLSSRLQLAESATPRPADLSQQTTIQIAVPSQRYTDLSSKSEAAPPPRLTTFRGPTSLEYSLGLASGNLRSRVSPEHESLARTAEKTAFPIAAESESLVERIPVANLVLNDPLQDLGTAEAKRLVHVFQNGPGAINPVVDTSKIMSVCDAIFRVLEEARATHCKRTWLLCAEQLHATPTVTLKLVVAIGSTLESCGINRLARALFESVRKPLASHFWALPTLCMIQNWILVAILHYQLDEELQANRVTAHAARLCLELGINRTSVLRRTFSLDSDRVFATNLTCMAFILDRRSSIGIGIPHVIPTQDMDINIVQPDDESMYLNALVNLAHISGDVYELTTKLSDKAATIPVTELEYLEFRVLQWQGGLPTSLIAERHEWRDSSSLENTTPAHLFRKFALVLRANQLRSLVHRPILYTSERISNHSSHAKTAIGIAQDTVRLLTDLNTTHPVMLHNNALLIKYFLISAFSVLMLAIANSPDTLRSEGEGRLLAAESMQAEFYMAVNLFEQLSTRSNLMANLWKSVQVLQSLALQAGMPPLRGTTHITDGGDDGDAVEDSQDLTTLPNPTAHVAEAPPAYLYADDHGMQLEDELSTLLGRDPSFSTAALYDPFNDLGADLSLFSGVGDSEYDMLSYRSKYAAAQHQHLGL